MTGLDKVIKIDVISVPFSGHLFPTLTLVKPAVPPAMFQAASNHFTGRTAAVSWA